MKRFFWILGAVFFVCAGPVLSVSAKDYTADQDGSYTVEISGKTADKDYIIIVVAGDYTKKELPEISEENIIYINRVTADANGTVSFNDFIPMTGSVGTIYIIGDEFSDVPGILMNDSGFGYIGGRLLSYSGDDDTVIVTEEFTEISDGAFSDSESTSNVILTNNTVSISSGAFSENIKLFISPLANEIKQYAVENGYSYRVFGDYNNDSIIDYNDMTGFLGYFANGDNNSDPDFELAFDLDMSGSVNLRDTSVLLSFLGGKITDFFKS